MSIDWHSRTEILILFDLFPVFYTSASTDILQEAISIVQSGFRDLDAFDADRIELLAPVNPGEIGLNDDWGLIMDEAWAKFKSSPPRRLKVQIRDGPGDKEARELFHIHCASTMSDRHECRLMFIRREEKPHDRSSLHSYICRLHGFCFLLGLAMWRVRADEEATAIDQQRARTMGNW